MKKSWRIGSRLLLAGFILAACSPQAQPAATSMVATRSPGSVQYSILVEKNLPPFITANYRGDLEGFDIDLMKALADQAGFSAKFYETVYGNLVPGVSQCQYDAGISAVTILDELKQQVVFSDAYLQVKQVLVVKKGNIKITGLDQLSGMTVGALQNSAGELAVKAIPGAELVSYPTTDAAVQSLINAMIDAVIVDQPQAQQLINIKANNLKIAGTAAGQSGYGIAVCAKKPELLKLLNSGIAALKSNGTLDKLIQKWLSN